MITSLEPALITMPLVPGEGISAGDARGVTVDADRLGDGHRAEVARIEHVDFAAGGGLRQRRGEGQAGRHARARIGIAARRRRDPGLARLRCRRMPRKSPPHFRSEFIVTKQVPLPLQAPLQPLKVAPAAGVAVRVTCVPLAKFACTPRAIDPRRRTRHRAVAGYAD